MSKNDERYPRVGSGEDSMRRFYDEKRDGYFASVRQEILPFLPARSAKALDVGCGVGATLQWVKQIGRCDETWGLEFFMKAAETARGVLDHVVIGDIEGSVCEFYEQQFDLILCLDVLEHLRDPWEAIRRITTWLRNGGTLIVSLPNLRYWTVVRDLAVKGSFAYQERGILDRTHLRFFTKESGVEMLHHCGLANVQVKLHPASISGKEALLNMASMGKFRDMFAWQLLLSGRKKMTGAALMAGNPGEAEQDSAMKPNRIPD